MKTPNQYLDEVSKEVGYLDFENMIYCRIIDGSKAISRSHNLIKNSVIEAMTRYANDIEEKLLTL